MKKYTFFIGYFVLILVTGFLYFKNQNLKMTIDTQKNLISSQKNSISVLLSKQQQSLSIIKQRQIENETIRKERFKNEQKWNKKASKEYHQWRSHLLPIDVVNRLYDKE